MIPAEQLQQCHARMQQATGNMNAQFGNLAANICGDFLQLPPIKKRSLAVPLDAQGKVEIFDEDAEVNNTKAAPQDRQANEPRQGFALWRSITRVVCLTVNVRAPGLLGRMQAEMRAGAISDEMWNLYMDRVLQADDPRLTDPRLPFANSDAHFIVFRHSIRVQRSWEQAKAYCRLHRMPLYSAQAKDDAVRSEDRRKLTAKVRAALLKFNNPDKTQGIPSFLPLHEGMRLVVASKDCVRYGVVKGCPCRLVSIVLADQENLPWDHVVGHFHSL